MKLPLSRNFQQQPHLDRILECSNDVEKNPGPPKIAKNQEPDALIAKIKGRTKSGSSRDRKTTTNDVMMSKPKTEIENGNGEDDIKAIKALLETHGELIKGQKMEMEILRKQLEAQSGLTRDFQSELSEIRKNWQQTTSSTGQNPDLAAKIEGLTSLLFDIQDRLYEIDKSWKNNLILFGVPSLENSEEDPFITEEKVREVLHKKLHISREIAMSRITRINYGPEFRGHKPIQLCLVNYRDKEELLRKARLLKGSNIYISEDFSRKVREHRHELIKFMKEVRSRDPARRMTLRYDKLYMGHDIFFFNDKTNRVEKLHQHMDNGNTFNSSLGNLIINDSQASLNHDSSWLRRPRSKIGRASRSMTPLSLSASMEDFVSNGNEDHVGHQGQLPPLQNRSAMSARARQRSFINGYRIPRKSASIESNMDSYESQQQLDNEANRNINNNNNRDGGIEVDAVIPAPQVPLEPVSTTNITQQQEEEEAGPPVIAIKATKTVAFKDVPEIDHETPRMLNGTPHHNPFPRPIDETNNNSNNHHDDETLTVVENGKDQRSYYTTVQGSGSGAQLSEVPMMTTALTPYRGEISPPAPGMTLPPIEFVEQTTMSLCSSLPSPSSSSSGLLPAITTDHHRTSARNNSSYEVVKSGRGGGGAAMRAPLELEDNSNSHKRPKTGVVVHLPGCSKSGNDGNGSGFRPTTGHIKAKGSGCNCPTSQEGGVIKVAMFGEFSMTNFQQRRNSNCKH